MATNHHTRPEGPGINFGPLAVGAIGVMITAAAFVALIIAGVAAGELFPTTSSSAQALQDRGVWMATQTWANPLGIVGLAVLFAGAVPFALANIKNTISYRRDAMTQALPTIISKGTES